MRIRFLNDFLKKGGLRNKLIPHLLLGCMLLLFISNTARSVVAFHGEWHGIITENALKDFTFSTYAIRQIRCANRHQDCPGGNLWDNPQFHGDRLYWFDKTQNKYISETHKDAFNRLRDYVQEQKSLIKDLLSNSEYKGALEAIGRALHAIQDFYAHSNYVDLGLEDQEIAKNALNNLNIDPPATLRMTGWEKGHIYVESIFGGKRENDPEGYHHADNNKDGPSCPNPADFNKARTAAEIHSKEFIQGLQISPEQWNTLEEWNLFRELYEKSIKLLKHGLLAPCIGLISTIVVATVATSIYTERVKCRKEKQ